MRRYLGISSVIWLEERAFISMRRAATSTNWPVSTAPGHVALTWTLDRGDPQYEISHDAYERLRRARDARGRELTIHKIHQPGPLFMTAEEAAGIDRRAGTHPRKAGDRLAGSYINFYIANKCIVMPLYDKRHDAAAMRTLKRLFPTRKVVGVATREVLLGGGNIHCITQQVPRSGAGSRGR